MTLSREDQIVRRNWLITYLICISYSLIVMLTTSLPNLLKTNFAHPVILVTMTLISLFGVAYICYHFAYRNRGTKLLTALIILGCLNLPYTLYLPFSKIPLFMPLPTYLISTALSFALLYAHYRLLKVNKRLKANPN